MLLQRGKFLIKDISNIDLMETNNDGIKRIIDLEYMGNFEYEGNTVPVSRMFIEYYNEEYEFVPVSIYNKRDEQMYFYLNKKILENKPEHYLLNIARKIIDRNYSLYQYINEEFDNKTTDFWWDLEGDYFIFFGDRKIELINYFINSCYKRDGEKEGIKQKLLKIGYKM